jgi:hypothetical protein
MSKQINDKLKSLDLLIRQIKSSAPAQVGESSHQRRDRVKYLLNNWQEFHKYYYPDWCKSPFAPFHIRCGDAAISFKQKKYMMALAWARNLSKTTFWQMHAPYINLRWVHGLSHGFNAGIWWNKTWDMAAEDLTSIRLQFEHNPKLKQDFGDFKSFGQWDENSFTTAQGIFWKALGKGQSPRGSKKDEQRVNFIIGNDFEDDEEILNDRRLEKSWQWYTDAMIPVMDVSDSGLYVTLNNILSKNGLQARALEMADYKDVVNLLDRRGKPTWKARHSLEDCQFMIKKMGRSTSTILLQKERCLRKSGCNTKRWKAFHPTASCSPISIRHSSRKRMPTTKPLC